ncbi:YiiX/YebB-like N1pC/P60 family cysteine hydrolase [Mechercharimyces sp. CAU 1602]|uniref:YiiX/YebB-like N1pC/P60 family cysteine hydrolase n=1 Tax=Mechercharimyces sp. CAU 1602 TaxID=2973933 RepID=UPI002162CE71|nr:YiiX/YebB-like N1pC/P60 family cysteine hydrolase [Mechercharimyces sp. CAU 1602]MCS1351038.1 YiiX/YebB-like N1pC/P60 family cysteine hydrolase [Mechercharimyces sp. CAU 1602]
MKAIKKVVLLPLSLALTMSIAFAPDSFASSSTGAEELSIEDLTPAELADLEEGIRDTQEELKNGKKTVDPQDFQEYVKDKGLSSEEAENQLHSNRVGTKGDIVVTLSGTSGGSAWAGGHAGVVQSNNYYVTESFGIGSKKGVQRRTNNWKARYSHVRGLWVRGADGADYSYAAAYSKAKIGKPYNYNFYNKTTTSRFYCSQLAWRSWKNRGFELDNGGAVWPVNLINDGDTKTFYSKG